MIRVHRPDAVPQALCDARQWRASRVIRALRQNPAAKIDAQKVEYAPDEWREALWRAQHDKCAVCERADIPRTSPIDHIRPWKLYPWLCWSAENLAALCSDCNSAKGERFPLDGARLPLGAYDTTVERPLWVDPTRECPTAHVKYVYDDTRGGEPAWVAVGLTDRGERTVQDFKLVEYHLEAWRKHIARVERDAQRLTALSGIALVEAWDTMIRRRLTEPAAPYRGLTRAWIDHHHPDSWRAPRGLTLPELADPGPVPADAPLFTPEPALDALPADLALCVREGRVAKDDAARREAARGLHALGREDVEIAALLGVNVATVSGYLR